MVGAKPRGPGMDRKDLLESNAALFKSQAKLIDKGAKSTTKILVVGNPCNTNALAILRNSEKIREQNITALSKLDEIRAVAVVAKELGIPSHWVKNVTIFGNHSKTMVVDVSRAFYVEGLPRGANISEIAEGNLFSDNLFLGEFCTFYRAIQNISKKS